MKKYLKEIKEEVALCQKYIDECDIFASKSEHEKLALKIASSCEQTLSALADEIKKVYLQSSKGLTSGAIRFGKKIQTPF